MGPWSGGLGTPALDHIPIQAQLSEEKRDGLMSRKLCGCLLGTCHIQAQCWGYHDENTFSALKELRSRQPFVFQVGAHTSVLPVIPGPAPGSGPKASASTIVRFGSGSGVTRKGWWLAGQLGQCLFE